MSKVSDLIGLLLLISFFAFCCGTKSKFNNSTSHNNTNIDDAPLHNSVVEDILRRVCNLSLNTFANKDPGEKTVILLKIEEKLKKSAETLGTEGEQYVKLIMKAVRSKAFEVADSKEPKITSIMSKDTENESKQVHELSTSKSKDELVHDIASKIEVLANTYLKGAKTQEEREEAIQKIKNKFMESANRRHAMLHNKHEEIKNYVDIVAKGLDVMMKGKPETDHRRRMEFAYTNNINLNKASRESNVNFGKPIQPSDLLSKEWDQDANDNKINIKSVFLRSKQQDNLKQNSPCDDIIKETCQKIKSVKTFKCQSDNREIHILKLCDGVGDCIDFSDEQQCAQKSIEVIQSANRVMNHIDTSLSRNCYPDAMDESIILKKNKILSDVLRNQLNFLHRHSLAGLSTYSKMVFAEDAQSKNTVNEALNVVDALSGSLETSLCSKLTVEKTRQLDDLSGLHEEPERYNNIFNNNDNNMGKPTKSSSDIWCQCMRQDCIGNCSVACQKICWEKYSLSQFQCAAILGEKSVSLDLLCDGKFDCYDETDETDCARDLSIAKFEATEMYNYLLKMITSKAASVGYKPVTERLLSLYAKANKLQKLTLKRNADVLEVKRIRDGFFAELMATYEITLHSSLPPYNAFEMQLFLQSLNERLVSALKRSHTGNDKIISSDGCVCRGYECVLPKCTKACTRACTAEPKLTRYFCDSKSSELNNSVPLELICNGKRNCRNGQDEIDCKTDVCRAHHLVLLRHNLRNVGKNQLGTALGEALRSWRIKVMATLTMAENNERPKPAVMREILQDVLHDLVMTYATVEDNRRQDPGAVFSEFYKWAHVVIDTLKSCGK